MEYVDGKDVKVDVSFGEQSIERERRRHKEPPPKKYPDKKLAKAALNYFGVEPEWCCFNQKTQAPEPPWIVSPEHYGKSLRIEGGKLPVVKFITRNGRDCIYAPSAVDSKTKAKPFCFMCEEPVDGWVEFGLAKFRGVPPNVRIGPCCASKVLIEPLQRGKSSIKGVQELIDLKQMMQPDPRWLAQQERMKKVGIKLGADMSTVPGFGGGRKGGRKGVRN